MLFFKCPWLEGSQTASRRREEKKRKKLKFGCNDGGDEQSVIFTGCVMDNPPSFILLVDKH